MTDATTAVIAKLETVLSMDAESILTQSLHRFVAAMIEQTQQRISQSYLDHQRFLRKYGMPLDAFMRALEAREDHPEENAQLEGVPLLEAVADSRWWVHVQEELAAATTRLEQLQALHT